MTILNKGHNFSSGDNVTATKLDDLVDQATFIGGAGGATDNSTLEVNDGVGGDGSIRVKDGGIITAKLADGAVSTQKIADSAVTSGKIADGAIIASKIAPSAASAIMPPGGLIPYAGINTPSGWLLCDGGTIGNASSGAGSESADYETLFNLIKTLHPNTGTKVFADGDTVSLPDLRGRVIAGKDDMGGTSANNLTGNPVNGDNLGATGGSESHLLTAAQSGLPEHTHGGGVSSSNTNGAAGDAAFTYVTQTTGVTGGAKDATSSHNNVQPTIILNYIIKY